MSPEATTAIALVATEHGPSAQMLAALSERGQAMGRFAGVYVCATDAKDERIVASLHWWGATVVGQPIGCPGTGRRTALAIATAAGHAAFPDELTVLPARTARRRPVPWFAWIGRTAWVFACHPAVQRAAEGSIGRALGIAVSRRIDATAGARWLFAEIARLVLAESRELTAATDLKWLALIHCANARCLASVTVEGLEFESEELAAAAVVAHGCEAARALATYDRSEVWPRACGWRSTQSPRWRAFSASSGNRRHRCRHRRRTQPDPLVGLNPLREFCGGVERSGLRCGV